MQNNLDGMKVAIIVTDNFEQVEMTEPRKALDHAGAETILIAPENDRVRGFQHDKAGETFVVDMQLEEADPNDFDALMLPGGALNADKLRVNKKALDFVQQMERDNKPIAFICHAPWVLISAGAVRNRSLTGYHTIKDDIVNAGGNYQDKQMVRDRNWVSSRQPSDIPAFNEAMISLFAEHVPAHSR